MVPLLLLLLPFSADTGARWRHTLRAESLGNSWSTGRSELRDGLEVRHFYNHTRGRSEIWHPRDGQWFLLVRRNLYVLACRTRGGDWRTAPGVRLVRHGGKWTRVETRSRTP